MDNLDIITEDIIDIDDITIVENIVNEDVSENIIEDFIDDEVNIVEEVIIDDTIYVEDNFLDNKPVVLDAKQFHIYVNNATNKIKGIIQGTYEKDLLLNSNLSFLVDIDSGKIRSIFIKRINKDNITEEKLEEYLQILQNYVNDIIDGNIIVGKAFKDDIGSEFKTNYLKATPQNFTEEQKAIMRNNLQVGSSVSTTVLIDGEIQTSLIFKSDPQEQINNLVEKSVTKDFVNSSIETATATFRGTYKDLDELKLTIGDKNDYTFYDHTDELGNRVFDRYKYNGEEWIYEYSLNNSSFTDAQWKAINSGITDEVLLELSSIQVKDIKVKNEMLTITKRDGTSFQFEGGGGTKIKWRKW